MKSEASHAAGRVFEVRDRVRWSDVDIAGIIYFGAYVRFVELAETELFRELGFPFARMFDQLDVWLPRVHLDFDFHRPARMDDELIVRTRVAKVGNSSIILKIAVHDAATDAVDASCTLIVATVGRTSMKSQPIPPELRAALLACI
ncbi:MAG: acyl-CoA thioesterase [Candidatus Eremiobacteraeota bacterium]|nr:acyl-CoA thioesterase [Candidatus Eremiobacteraeota bacterium]MBV9736681.1 acyl-CoA thioesterase [Candidatus Eremiobacteraeota bacterium]